MTRRARSRCAFPSVRTRDTVRRPDYNAHAMMRCSTRSIRTAALAITAGLVMMPVGCGATAEVVVRQPARPGRQREMTLESLQVSWAGDEREERVVAEFPLPGAATGKPMYLLYLRYPAGHSTPRAEGFFIQTRGELAGLVWLVDAEITVSGTSDAPTATRHLEVDLVYDDSTRIVGELTARRDPHAVRRFETERRPADVQALRERTTPTQGG